MPLTAEANAKREHVAKITKEDEAVLYIAKLDHKINIPVVISILENIEKTTMHSETKDYLQTSIKTLQEVDALQHASRWHLFSIFKNSVSLFQRLKDLVNGATEIMLTDETLADWQEAARWLEGMYKRTELMLPQGVTQDKLKDVRIDNEDRILHAATGKNKIKVALKYHRAAENLKTQIQIFIAGPQKAQALN